MQTITTIFCKELRRVLFDRKMLLALFVLPVIVMLVIYGVMGIMVMRMQDDIQAHKSRIIIYQAPDDFKEYVKQQETKAKQAADITFYDTTRTGKKTKEEIRSGKADVMILFAAGFHKSVAQYKHGDAVPQIKTYYNPSEDYSENAKNQVDGYLEGYRKQLLQQRIGDLNDIQIFTVDSDNKESIIQDEHKAGGKMLGTFLPYMISMLLFAGVMSLGVDAIAGEKERGTMATMLVAPVKRSHIVYGKLLALMVLSALSALVYGSSMVLSFPTYAKTMNASGASLQLSAGQIVLLLLLIVSLVFVYVAIISAGAVFARSVKEASSYISPVYMLVIVMGMMTMFVTGDTPTTSYLIPVYGSSMAMRNILMQEISNGQVMLTIGVNLIVGVLIAAVVTKVFDDERIM